MISQGDLVYAVLGGQHTDDGVRPHLAPFPGFALLCLLDQVYLLIVEDLIAVW